MGWIALAARSLKCKEVLYLEIPEGAASSFGISRLDTPSTARSLKMGSFEYFCSMLSWNFCVFSPSFRFSSSFFHYSFVLSYSNFSTLLSVANREIPPNGNTGGERSPMYSFKCEISCSIQGSKLLVTGREGWIYSRSRSRKRCAASRLKQKADPICLPRTRTIK